jgi:monofunctional glycosyltransferase
MEKFSSEGPRVGKRGRRVFLFLFLFPVLVLPVLYFCFWPDISGLKRKNPGKTSMMEFRERERKSKGGRYRVVQVWVPLSRISPYLVKAVLIGEDDKFWKHEGFDYEAIQKAVEKNLQQGKYKFGGSTITQQLAKNLYLSPEKSLWRKMRETVITWQLERTLSKKRILELYLNVAEWGDGFFGAEAAARHYFGKRAADLTGLEAARLAAVLPNPRKYDPNGTQRYVLNRSGHILKIMIRRGIVEEEFESPAGASGERNSGSPEWAPIPPAPR